MGMFGMFGKKEGGYDATTGEWGSDNVEMMKMLAGMPHMMRKPMMKGRINQLLTLTEEKRQESIRDMIGAFHSAQVKPKARESLVSTRIEIVGELPEAKRRTIIASRTEALKVAPELEQTDQKMQEKVLPKLAQSTRNAFLSTWEDVQGKASR